MKKILSTRTLALFLISTFAVSNAFAENLYHYKATDNAADGCVLKKFDKKNWQVVDASEVGDDSFSVQISKLNAEYSNFKYKGSWFAAKTICFVQSDATAKASPTEASVANGAFKKGSVFAEADLSKFFMGSSPAVAGITSTTYSASVAIAGRIGYYLNPKSNLFVELGYFTASQTLSGTVSGALSDKFINFNVGYQYYFAAHGKFTPFAAASIGYNSLKGTFTFANNSAYAYTASGVGGSIEAGSLYELSSSFSVLGTLNYHLASFSPTVTETTSSVPVGSAVNAGMSYNHFGITLGARYNF